jgi:hypothetical protein
MGTVSTSRQAYAAAGLLAGLLALTGCAGIPGTEGAATTTTTPSGTSGNVFGNLFTGQPAPGSQPVDPNTTRITGIECPPVDVRQGAGSYALHANPREQTITTVRYQFSLGQLARECAILGQTMTMKVGVQGRLVVGPAGGPGSADAPIRIALVREGPSPQTIWTRFYRVPVAVGAGQTGVTFTHVEEDLTIPLPPKEEFNAFVIYVGYDPVSLQQQPARTGRRT